MNAKRGDLAVIAMTKVLPIVEPGVDVDRRLTALARAVYRGASNPTLIKRAGRLADDIEAEHPDLAARLRVALTKRGESLGDRYDRLRRIQSDFGSHNPARAS